MLFEHNIIIFIFTRIKILMCRFITGILLSTAYYLFILFISFASTKF